MIDWLTFVAPLAHVQGEGGPLFNGVVLSTSMDPELGEMPDWQVYKRRKLVGSYSSSIQVQSTSIEGRPALWFSGNPSKWFQGHNIFGSDDLAGLVRECLWRVCKATGICPTLDDLADWEAGRVQLLRVDLTRSWDLGSTPRVRNALRSLDATAHLKHRGRGHFKGDSLTFGKGSRRWSLTLYAKGPELDVHPLHPLLLDTSLPAHAAGLLRAEVRMLSMQLKEEQLDQVSAWGEFTAAELHQRYIEGLHVAEATMIDSQAVQALPHHLRATAQLWQDGHDLRAILSRPTFYRQRRELLKHGIDIAVKQDRQADSSNVVPLRTVLVAHPVSVPDWAQGTPLYFEPRIRFG